MDRPDSTNVVERAEALSSFLEGTCESMPDWVSEDPDEIALLEHLDQLVFLCDCCGWWCEASEAEEGPDGSDYCGRCAEEARDDGHYD